MEDTRPSAYLSLLNSMWPDWARKCRATLNEYRDMYSVPPGYMMPTQFPLLAFREEYEDDDVLRRCSDWLMSAASMYLWRMTKGIYRFDATLYNALVAQPLEGDLPIEILNYLPEWAVYIETPGLKFDNVPLDGFIAHLDYCLFPKSFDLQFALFLTGKQYPRTVAVPLGEGTLVDALNRLDKQDAESLATVGKRPDRKATTMIEDFAPLFQLLIYLCSTEADMPPIQHPRERVRSSGAVDSPKEHRVWDVGVRIGAAIRSYVDKEATAGESHPGVPGREVRPHIRRAHWHHFWTGSKDAQKLIVKWLPPIPVNAEFGEDFSAVIRPVKK